MKSPYGRRFSLPEAAEYLGLPSSDTLYGLVRQRRITFHRADVAPRTVTRTGRDGQVVKSVRGGDYFFYEAELLAWIESTRVEAEPVAGAPAPMQRAADISAHMPAERRFS